MPSGQLVLVEETSDALFLRLANCLDHYYNYDCGYCNEVDTIGDSVLGI